MNEKSNLRSIRSSRQHFRRFAVLTLLATLLGSALAAESPNSTPHITAQPSVSLLLEGYNYTDHYIDSYVVNGQGGGNIFESGPNSGGSKSSCCVTWQPVSKLPVKIKIRWTTSYCMKSIRTKFGDYAERRSIFKEQDAWITQAVADKPSALEVHFYADGHIEAAVTQGNSPPRLKLLRDENYNRPGVNQDIPKCSDDQN